jgi:hypothetical protein
MRQIEMADLMNRMKNYSKSYAAGLVSRTKEDQLSEQAPAKRPVHAKAEDIARMEAEMQSLDGDILEIKESWGRDVVNLTIARGYVKKLPREREGRHGTSQRNTPIVGSDRVPAHPGGSFELEASLTSSRRVPASFG